MFNVEVFMQYITYALMAIGVLAFVVSVITQVVKELPGVKEIQTSVVVLTVSVIICLLAVCICCQYYEIKILWYYLTGAIISAFIVYLVSTGGWERITEIWSRTKYNNKD